jgi:hypothetical protein
VEERLLILLTVVVVVLHVYSAAGRQSERVAGREREQAT